MNRIALCFLSAALAASAQAASTDSALAPTTKREAAAAWSAEGLRPLAIQGLDLSYIRPGARLSGYRQVRIAPVEVQFQRQWQRYMVSNTGTRIRARDVSAIRRDLALVVREQVARELSRGGLEVVDHAGPGVLDIDLQVADLYLNVPDLPTANITRSYTRSFGELTLVATLRDGGDGGLLMRSLDRTVGSDLGRFQRTTRVENTMDVGMAAANWARALRRQL
jgi:hypothetical protein